MGKTNSRSRRSKKKKQDKKGSQRSKSGWKGADLKTCTRPTSTYSANTDHATKTSRPDYSMYVVTGVIGAVLSVGLIVGNVVAKRAAGGTSAANAANPRKVSAGAGSELDRLEYDEISLTEH